MTLRSVAMNDFDSPKSVMGIIANHLFLREKRPTLSNIAQPRTRRNINVGQSSPRRPHVLRKRLVCRAALSAQNV